VVAFERGEPLRIDTIEVRTGGGEAEARIGHHVVPVRHEVALGHGRQPAEVVRTDRSEVDARQALPVVRGAGDGVTQGVGQRSLLVGAQLLS
jgi:hypothetical protein